MDQLKSIVAAVDFSEPSIHALFQAIRMARWNNAQLHVIHVIDSLVLQDLQRAIPKSAVSIKEAVLSEAKSRIQKVLQQAGTEGVLVNTHVVLGNPFAEVFHCVKRHAADLLVMGSSGSGDPAQGAGTLAAQCVRKMPTKVLLVRRGHRGPFTRIVAGVDFSDTSRHAVEEAIKTAKQDKAHLDIIHVYFPPWQVLHWKAPTPEANPDFIDQYVQSLHGYMSHFLQPLEADLSGVDFQIHFLENRRAANGVIEFLNRTRAELAVVGTRGRSALSYLLMGATAERTVRESPCSVLAIKPKEFTFDLQ